MLALCFMIRGEHQRLGYGRKIAICAALGFVIRLTGFGLASAAESDPSLNIVQYALPLSVSAGCAWYLLRRKRIRSLKHIFTRKPKTSKTRQRYMPS
jgi:lipopolysaccharide export system permease protein